MQPQGQSPATSSVLMWTGRVLSVLVSLAMLMSAIMKFVKPAGFLDELAKLGWDETVITNIGIVEILCVVLYLIPQTAILGAILLTGYLGGAIATHVRIHDGFIPPVVLGVIVWAGLWCQCPRLRALLPLRK